MINTVSLDVRFFFFIRRASLLFCAQKSPLTKEMRIAEKSFIGRWNKSELIDALM